jgi:hypothetical protein
MKAFLKRLSAFFGGASHKQPNRSPQASVGKTCGSSQQLSDVEIQLLTLLEGKRANDPSVLGWWCAFHEFDGPRAIDRLRKNNFLALADYRFRVRKSTVPTLKEFLKKRGLPAKGKKNDLVNRIIENIPEADCLGYFTQSYWALTPKAVGLLRAEEIKAQHEYDRIIDLIRKGSYNVLRAKLYPNRNEHWSTEDTLCETIDYVMKHCFEGFVVTEEIRRNMASFVAAHSVDYSSRSYSRCTEGISSYLSSLDSRFSALSLPASLGKYAKENEIEGQDEILTVYIEFIINRARAIAELNQYRGLGIQRVRIDALACPVCRGTATDKVYNISKAPLLPLNWDCRCAYESVLRPGR